MAKVNKTSRKNNMPARPGGMRLKHGYRDRAEIPRRTFGLLIAALRVWELKQDDPAYSRSYNWRERNHREFVEYQAQQRLASR